MNKGLPNGEPIEEKRALDMLSKKSFTVLVVGGNHENYDRLELAYKEVDLCGGKAKKLRDNVYFLESGYIFNISGKKIFTFNGAASHDTPDGIFDPDDFRTEKGFEAYRKDRRHMMARTKYVSWWQQEMSDEECMTRGHHNLDLAGWKVDMIITHCLPTEAQAFYSHGPFKKDRLTDYLQDIAYNVTCPIWFSGHYHDNKEFRLDGRKYIVLYEQFIQMQ